MQTQHALSTTESKYIGLLHAIQYVKGTIYLLQEMEKKLGNMPMVATTYCNLWEDNQAALIMAKEPKMHPKTQHLNLALHHFHSEVPAHIDTKDQEADILTKPVNQTTFKRPRP